MKITFVVHDFLSGVGHGRYCIELARRLASQHEIHVLANRFDDNFEFPFHRHFVSAWRKSALASVLTFPRAAQRIIDRENFDIVHAQGYCCQSADIVTAHVCNAARYKRSPATSLAKRVFPFLVIPRERTFYQRLRNRAQFISISKVIQRELTEEYGVASDVIYHGIDTKTFSPAPRENRGESKWLFVGEAVKGLTETLEALRRFPDARLKVVSRSIMGPWQDHAKKIGVSERVDFRGPTGDMTEVYRTADIFVYPSSYDAFGMVVAEAMACGLPVVIDHRIGAAEWIVDGVNGFVSNPETFIQKLEEARTRPEIGRAARETALTHTWDICAQRALEIYERAIASKRTKQ